MRALGLVVSGVLIGFGAALLVQSREGAVVFVQGEALTGSKETAAKSDSRKVSEVDPLSNQSNSEGKVAYRDARLSVVLDLLEEGTHISGLGLSDQFEWGDRFYELLGLDEGGVERVKLATQELLRDLKDYESEKKQLVEEDESKLIYKVGADVELLNVMRDGYLSEPRGIAGDEVARLANQAVVKKFEELEQERVISLRVYDEEQTAARHERMHEEDDLGRSSISYGRYQSYRLRVTRVDENGNERGGSSRGGMLTEGETPRHLLRYDHLFEVE